DTLVLWDVHGSRGRAKQPNVTCGTNGVQQPRQADLLPGSSLDLTQMTCASTRMADALGCSGLVSFGWHTPCFKVLMLNKQHLIQAIFERTHVLLGAATVILSPAKLAAGLKNSIFSKVPA